MSRLEQLLKLVAIAPNDPMSHYGVGLEYINLQRWSEAAGAFERAIAADARYSAAYYQRGRALISDGKPDEARQVLEAGMTIAQQAGDWHTQGEMSALLETIE